MNEVVGMERPMVHWLSRCYVEVPQTSCIPGRAKIVGTKNGAVVADDQTDEEVPTRGGRRRPGQTVECGWCGRSVLVPARGRVPSWCSSSCRHRAWETRRANREQPPEVRVVTQTIEVDRPVIRNVEVPIPTEPRNAQEWATLLETFATRLAQGRIYRRDLPALEPAVQRLAEVWIRTVNPKH